MRARKQRVFVSYSSRDKSFVSGLVSDVALFGIDVWYDEGEIAVGDSIVEKVFSGLEASDTVVVVLSAASVQSRWVQEELSTALMRRLSDNDIRILPVLIETCDIPIPLRHIKYADFRERRDDGLFHLLNALAPDRFDWQTLRTLYDQFELQCSRIENHPEGADEALLQLQSLLELALNLRIRIEFRRAREKVPDLTFFGKIGALAEKGIDVRSEAWNALVFVRSTVTHKGKAEEAMLYMLLHQLERDSENKGDLLQRVASVLGQLKSGTRAVRRKDGSLTVADGVIFPILSAMSQFVVLSPKTGRWTLDIPAFFEDEEMIEAAREQLSGHDGNPMLMGRDAAVYETLALIPKMVLRLAKRVGQSA